MGKSRKLGCLPSFLLSLPGEKGRIILARTLARLRHRSVTFTLPSGLREAGAVLIVLPPDSLSVLHHTGLLLALIDTCNRARIILMCDSRVPAFLQGVQGVHRVIEYDPSALYLFSPATERMLLQIREERCDIAICLAQNAPFVLLSILGRSGIPIRAGYDSLQAHPFLNVRLRLQDDQGHPGDQAGLLGEVLGCRPQRTLKWVIARETEDEVDLLLKDAGLDPGSHLAGIDIAALCATIGWPWVEKIMAVLQAFGSFQWYCIGQGETPPEMTSGLSGLKVPRLMELSVSRCAALIRKSSLIISGPSCINEMAFLLQTPCIGLFRKSDLMRHRRDSSHTHDITYGDAPDDATLDSLGTQVLEMESRSAARPRTRRTARKSPARSEGTQNDSGETGK